MPCWPGKQVGMEKPKRARRRKPDTAKANLEPVAVPEGRVSGAIWNPKGMRRKYRAVVNGGHPEDEQVGQRWGKVEPALWGRRRFSFIHRTKVFAGGTIRKIHV